MFSSCYSIDCTNRNILDLSLYVKKNTKMIFGIRAIQKSEKMSVFMTELHRRLRHH